MASIVDGAVTLNDGRTFTADAVVVTAGAVPLAPSIEGLDFALPLRTAGGRFKAAREDRHCVERGDRGWWCDRGAAGRRGRSQTPERRRHHSWTAPRTLLAGLGAATGGDAARILGDRGGRRPAWIRRRRDRRGAP